jgi:hypothetical protein
VGESIVFPNKNSPNTSIKTSGIHRKSNYLSGFDLEMDTTHSFKISNILQAE